jgi:carbon storage regulator
MLVLSRRIGEEIVIGNDIRLRIAAIKGNSVRLAIAAPRQVPIHREEVHRLRHQFAANDRQPIDALPAARTGGTTMSKKKIVLATNDDDDIQLVRQAIEAAAPGAELFVVRDGEAALQYLLGDDDHPASRCDLLLLDWQLPQLDGLKVMRQLRWLYRDHVSALPPIVLISACHDGETVATAFRHGADGFLAAQSSTAPPFTDALQNTIRYWLAATIRPESQPRPLARRVALLPRNRVLNHPEPANS